MTDSRIPVTEDELHAYVDNELPAERRGDVEAWLATHPDDAGRVQSWRAMAEMLHARYDQVADEAVPKRLEIERLVRQPRKWIVGAIAATLVAFLAGGGSGDLYFTTRIMLPDGNDADLEALMQRWRADHPYNPRSDLG